ncbi:MAG: DUF1653 domain-containing protein [Betaproteobacteria bacterium]|jgi:hypothetical protein|nr:DUF1653 domain-containing protein [Rubrivivax sp.]
MQDDAGSDLPALPPAPPGRYRHYKGGEYRLLGVVRHSETLEPLVLYRPLHGDRGDWVRPHTMFFETVTIDGVVRPRFERVGD